MNSFINGLLGAVIFLVLMALAHDQGYTSAMLDQATGQTEARTIFSYGSEP